MFCGKCPQLTALRALSSLKAASTLQPAGALCVLPIEISFVAVSSGPTLQPSDVFEQPVPAGQRKIEFHITVPDAAAGVEENGRGQKDDKDTGTYSYCFDIWCSLWKSHLDNNINRDLFLRFYINGN